MAKRERLTLDKFPALTLALGQAPKRRPFPGVIICSNCDDRTCWCCDQCDDTFGLCEHREPPPQTPEDQPEPAVLAAVRVLAEHGIDGTKYEALQAMRAVGRA